MRLMDIDGEFTRGKAKYSGGARQLGIEGLNEFCETKHL